MLDIAGRRILLSIHLLLNSLLIGGLVGIVYLVMTTRGLSNGDELYAAHLVMFRIHDTLVMNAGFGVIITGLLFSLFTRWGFFDFYWVIFKWVGLAVLFIGITFFLAPAINGMAAISDVERSQVISNPLYRQCESEAVLIALLLLLLLVALVVVSVFKPWGQRKHPFRVQRKTVLLVGSVVGLAVASSALFQFLTLQNYRSIPITHVDLATVADGSYVGEAMLAFDQQVEVLIANHTIHRIDILKNDSGIYAKLAEGVTVKVLKAQTPAVTAVTGATTSSTSLLKAIENAISKGRITQPED